MNKKIRKSYEKITIPDYVEKDIIRKTVNSKSNIKSYRKVLTIGVIVLFVIFVGSVNAENIESLLARIFDNGALVDIDGNRYQMYEEVKGVKFKDLSGLDEYFVTNLDEVEKLVGVNLLKYDYSTSNQVSCDLIANSEIHSKHKGRVERVYVFQSDFYRPKEYGTNENVYTGFSLLRRMISDEAEEHTKLSYLEEMNVMANKRVIEEYYSDNLDTKVLLYDYICDDEMCAYRDFSEIYAMFVYKNIRYEIFGYFNDNVPIDKLKEIIEDLHE